MQTFQELSLSPLLMRAIQEVGYETPSPIQAQALPILLGEPTDFIGLAATGTGKTAAFSIPMLERIDPANPEVQALILCPTRELALQVAGQVNLLGKHLGVKALPIYGGAGYGDQLKGLKRGTAVVVGTPGRVVDHLEKGTLRLGAVQTVILDEADEMISMGFKEDLEAVLGQVPREEAKIWLFSATMSGDVRDVAENFLSDPRQVQVNRTEMLPDTIEQLYYRAHESDKPEILCKLIDAADDFYGLVFCQTKALVVDLTQYLKGRGYLVDCLHGDMEQDARERTMKTFRDRLTKVLVCTDVASRGLDVKDITHVINYSIPRELDNYVHRIGRTARSGKRGLAMSLVTPSHRGLIPRIERMTKSRMQEGRLPTRRELAAKKVASALARFQDQPMHARALEVMSEEWKQALAGMSPEEVASRFLAAMHPEVFAGRASASAAPKREAPVKPLVQPVVAPSVVPAAPEPVVETAAIEPVPIEPAPAEAVAPVEIRPQGPLKLADFVDLEQPVRKPRTPAAKPAQPKAVPVAPLAEPVETRKPRSGKPFARKPHAGKPYGAKPFARKGGFKQRGWVGKPKGEKFGSDAGLGRAPQESFGSPWKKKKPSRWSDGDRPSRYGRAR